MKQEILQYIKDFYGVEVEFLWESSPENGAFRNPRNKKWFAVLLGSLPKSKLGIKSGEKSDVLNLKCDPILSFALVDNARIFPGYHMNKEHWISVLLDGSVSTEELKNLVDMSFEIVDRKTANKRKKAESTV